MTHTSPQLNIHISDNDADTFISSLHSSHFVESLLAKLPVIGLPGWKAKVREAAGTLEPRLGTLVRFWIVGDDVPKVELASIFEDPLLDALTRAGVIEQRDDTLRAAVTLAPAGDFVVACDRVRDEGEAGSDPKDVPGDFVLGVGHATRIVDDLSVREPCEVALDVGCGQGFLSLRARTHAKHCIGTDISPRALDFARLNEALNARVADTPPIDWRLGSFFEPVSDLRGRAGLVTCNPPFVIASGSGTRAISSSFEGDGAMEHVVRGSLDMLAPGGWASIVGMWEANDTKDWSQRPRSWLANRGVDVLMLLFDALPPAEHFRRWTQHASDARQAGFLDSCEKRGVKLIVFGAMVLHRRDGTNWMRTQAAHPQARNGSASAQLRGIFDTQTRLNDLPNVHAVLDARLRVSPDVGYRPAQAPGETGTLFHARGLGMPMPCTIDVARCLQSFDGARTARAALRDAEQRGVIGRGVDDSTSARIVHALASGGYLHWAHI